MAISITRQTSVHGGDYIRIENSTTDINSSISMGFKELTYNNPKFSILDEETDFRLDFERADISVPVSSDDLDLLSKLNDILY